MPPSPVSGSGVSEGDSVARTSEGHEVPSFMVLDTLRAILVQMKIMNLHLSLITDRELSERDVE